MEAAMNRGKSTPRATALLIGIGVFLSACAAEPDYNASAYAYGYDYYPAYGSLDFDDFGGCCDRHHRDFHDHFHDHGDHDHDGHGYYYPPYGTGGHGGHR
jgi:hypothetical protein